MLNEVLQWATLGILLALIAGLYWHHGSLISSASGRIEDRSGPRAGDHLPKELMGAMPLPGEAGVIAFVAEGCRACAELLANLELNGLDQPQNILLVAATPSAGYLEALEEVGPPVLVDDGALMRRLGISATPFLVYMDAGGRVVAKVIDHYIEMRKEG